MNAPILASFAGAAVLAVGAVYGIPVAEKAYQQHAAESAVRDIRAAYTVDVGHADAALRLAEAEAHAAHDAALANAKQSRDESLSNVRIKYPLAVVQL